MDLSNFTSFLQSFYGTRFCSVNYTVDVKTSAKFRNLVITKDVVANTQVFSNLKDFTDCYKNAVIKSGKKLDHNDIAKLENFEKSETSYFHDKNLFSLATNKKDPSKKYMFCIYNSVTASIYKIDGKVVDKNEILQYLTASEQKKLTDNSGVIYNKKNDISHSVICRTIAVKNITAIK